MLETMRTLALCHLKQKHGDGSATGDLDEWFRATRKEDGGVFFPYLVEAPGKITQVYILKPDPRDASAAILEGADVGSLSGEPQELIPFCQPSGPRSPQLGPVIKRSHSSKAGPGPKAKTLQATLAAFSEIAGADKPWSAFFAEVVDVWSRKTVRFAGETTPAASALEQAVQLIPDTNSTVYLVYQDQDGRYPGQIPEYVAYLSEVLAQTKYATRRAQPVEDDSCPLCGIEHVTTYPSACTGAGINISNIDRDGAFPGLTVDNAHLGYSLCLDCADLLFTFKNSLQRDLQAPIAGDMALVLPHFELEGKRAEKAVEAFGDYVKLLAQKRTDEAATRERSDRRLSKRIAETACLTTIDIIWATFGNKMEGIRGQILDVLPSRIKEIEDITEGFDINACPYAPKHWLDEFEFGASLHFLLPLLRRPGGRRSSKENASDRAFNFKRDLVEAIYRAKEYPRTRLVDELLESASWYLSLAQGEDHPELSMLYEGYSPKKQSTWLTLAGWIRHVAVCMDYFQKLGLLEEENEMSPFEPKTKELKPYLAAGGIGTKEKAFAFILGVLFGRVMSIQAARGVNVGANALTWLKRLQLKGADLPELFIKVREKLLAYEADKSPKLRSVVRDMSNIGTEVGTDIQLSQQDTCYFLLLGQALSTDIFAKETPKGNDDE